MSEGSKDSAKASERQSRQPGLEREMSAPPRSEPAEGATADRLAGTSAVITGGDSGIGRAVAAAFAAEGADVCIVYLDEHDDARETARLVEGRGARAQLLAADLADPGECRRVAREAWPDRELVDILVNNAGEQHPHPGGLGEIDPDLLERTFRTNVLAMFHLTQALLARLASGGAIVNSTSVTAYAGHPALIDYSATKGAIVSFTRSLALSLADRDIRVNAVAPGPVWTPLIPATFEPEQLEDFGESVPLDGPAQPAEIAPSYVFLASQDAAFMTGQVLHPNGGTIIGG